MLFFLWVEMEKCLCVILMSGRNKEINNCCSVLLIRVIGYVGVKYCYFDEEVKIEDEEFQIELNFVRFLLLMLWGLRKELDFWKDMLVLCL